MKLIKYFTSIVLIIFINTPFSYGVSFTVGGTGVKNTAGEEKWLTFERNIKRLSNDEIKVKMLIYGELGPEENLVSGIRRGRIHVANWSGLAGSTVVPELSMLYAPFLFDNYEEADFIMDNFLFKAYSELLSKKNVFFISWDEIGFNQVYSKEPILYPADMQGIRFRIASSESSRLFARALGADAIPTGFTDIVTGLQTGLIESGENAIIMYAPTGIAAEATNLLLTDHSFATSIIVARKKWLDKLSNKNQKIIKEAYLDKDVSRKWTREEISSFLKDNQKWGFKINQLSKNQRNEWKKSTSQVTKKLIEKIGGESSLIWDLVQEGKREFKKNMN